MDLASVADLRFRFSHRHDDGTVGTFEPKEGHHGPDDHDPERAWATGTIYKCTTCDEEIAVGHEDPSVIRP
jgi:hypothetical protein